MLKRKVSRKKIFYAVIIVVTIIITALYSYTKNDLLQTGLPAMLHKKSDNLYKFSYDSISVDELAGNAFIKNLRVTPDTSLQQQFLKSESARAAKLLVGLQIPEVKLVGLQSAKALLSKKIICDSIIIINPVSTVYLFDKKDDGEAQPKEPFYKKLLPGFDVIKAGKVAVINANTVVKDFETGKTNLLVKGFSIKLNDLLIDSAANADTTRTFFSKQLAFSAPYATVDVDGYKGFLENASYNTVNSKLRVTTTSFQSKEQTKPAITLQNVTIDQLKVHGSMERQLVSMNTLNVAKVSFQSLQKQESNNRPDTRPISHYLPQWLKKFTINTVLLKDVSVHQKATNKGNDLNLDHFNIALRKVHLDSTSSSNDSFQKLFGDLTITNPNVIIPSSDKLYKFSFSGIECNAHRKTIKLKNVSITPTLSEADFARNAKVRKDRFDTRFNNITCTNVDFDKLARGEINIGKIETNNSYFKDFIDLHYPPDGKNRVGRYPNQLLFNLKQQVNIAALVFKNIFIEYKEKSVLSDSSGKVRFEHSNLVINNVTNRPGNNAVCNWNFSTRLLDKAVINARMQFYLKQHEQGRFSISGEMAKVEDATIFNELTKPMSLIEIKKGTINNASFNLTGDNYVFKGTVHLDYDHFRMLFLKKTGDDKIRKKNIKTTLANLLVRNSNEEKKGKQDTYVHYKRDVTKPFFFSLWQCIFQGLNDVLVRIK